MKKVKRITTKGLSAMICLSLFLMGTVPVNASEEATSVKSIVYGASHLKGIQTDSVYFGNYQQNSLGNAVPESGVSGIDWVKSETAVKNEQGGYYQKAPVKWRVLSNSDGKIFVVSDKNLDVFPYHTECEAVTWETSAIRSWLNGYSSAHNIVDTDGDRNTVDDANNGRDYSTEGFMPNVFSDVEKDAVAVSEVINAVYEKAGEESPNPMYAEVSGGNNTSDKLFLLSASEAQNSSLGFTDDASRCALSTDFVYGGGSFGERNNNSINGLDWWWLRTPGGNHIGNSNERAAVVTIPGDVDFDGNFVHIGANAVRPAMNINCNAVVFASAANGGKDAEGMESGLTQITDGEISEWKLTIADGSRENFTARKASADGNKISIAYENAIAGSNEYISAVIQNKSGEITHYGRIANVQTATGTVEIDLSAYDMNENELYVFNEQYNGNYKTDYASELVSISPDADEITEFGIVALGADKKSTEVTIPVAGTYTVIFVDYENSQLKNVDIVKKEFGVGKFPVSAVQDIALEAGDKIMLWDDILTQKPMCDSFEITQ